MVEELISTLENLREKANELKRNRDEYNELSRKFIEERDVRNNEISKLLNEAKETKNRRDNVNSEVADLKKKKAETEEKIKEYKNRFFELENEMKEINASRTPMSVLKNELKEIEWKLQTSVLTIEEENRIVKTISELENKLEIKSKQEKIKNQLSEFKTELTANRIILRDIKNKIVSSAKNSQNEHNSMGDIYKKVDEIRKAADEYHNKFIESKKTADEYHNQYISIKKEMQETISRINKIKENDKKDKQKNIEMKLDKMAKTAQEKLKSGDKLSFDEFQILMEKGLI